MGFVKYEQDGFIGVITINRPEALNALNTEVIQDLDAVLDSIDLGTTRVLVVTGAGEKSFGTSLIIYNRCVCSRFSLAISSSVFSFSPNMPYFVVNSSCARSCSSSYRFFFLHVSSFASRNRNSILPRIRSHFRIFSSSGPSKEAGITMAVDTKVMNHVRNNCKKPLVNRPDVTVTVSVPQSLINTDDVLFPYGNPFP